MLTRFILVLFLLLCSASLHAQTPFYQGKTITIIVGTKAGDVYDLYPRLVAEFMPKYIPGSPNIIIQNVAGAAGLIATVLRQVGACGDDQREQHGERDLHVINPAVTGISARKFSHPPPRLPFGE